MMERDKLFMAVIVALLIFLSVTLYLGIINQGQTGYGNWSLSMMNASITYQPAMYVDHYGTFYTVAGNGLYAISQDGTIKWSVPVIYDWNNFTVSYLWDAVNDNGRLYAIVGQHPAWRFANCEFETVLMAITDEGKILWKVPVSGPYPIALFVSGERVFTYYPGNLSAYDLDGSLQWISENVYSAPTMSQDGTLYVMNSSDPEKMKIPIHSSFRLDAYFPNGSLRWSRNLADLCNDGRLTMKYPASFISLDSHVDTLYLFSYGMQIAINNDGAIIWAKEEKTWVELAGYDDDDRIYTKYPDFHNHCDIWSIVSPDGTFSMNAVNETYFNLSEFSNGIAYTIDNDRPYEDQKIDNLGNFSISAYDILNNRLLWEYTITPEPVRKITLNKSNTGSIISELEDFQNVAHSNNLKPEALYESMKKPYGWQEIRNHIYHKAIVSGNILYFYYWAYNYEYPAFYNKSDCLYTGGLYAFNTKGKLLWHKDLDSYITGMIESNGTIYYGIKGGRFSAMSASLSTGVLAAAVYLFLRFFLIGMVSRARAQLDKNHNRMRILDIVARCPACTQYDLARKMGMNAGTVRYHLLVLSINRKIKACKYQGKHTRYFVNQGQYTSDEMLILSLMRCENMGRLLHILISNPGVQNLDISKAMDLHDSAVSRYLRELTDRGIVEKRRLENGRLCYTLDDRFREAFERLTHSNDFDLSMKRI